MKTAAERAAILRRNFARVTIAAGHPVRLHFTRKFTKGNLKGLFHEDSLDFFDGKPSALEWVRKVNANNRRGLVDYKVVKYRIAKR